MLKEFIKHNNASLIYECSAAQIERLIEEEGLSKDEIIYLKEKMDKHFFRMESFKYVLSKIVL